MERSARTGSGDNPEPNRAPEGDPSSLRVSLLGGFEVSAGSLVAREGEWRLRKAASLVKLLALTPHHRLHREQILDLLWPDLSPRAAANNLHQALHVARRTLEPGATTFRYLRLQDEQVVLCPSGRLWVDVDAFERAAEEARRSREPAAYRTALELYAGDLLPRDRYEEWAEERRAGLRRTCLALLFEVAALHEERDSFGQAVEALREILSSEPAHEEAHVSLMRLYARTGQRYQALRQYEQLRQALQRELGTEPHPASRQAYEEILAGHVPVAGSPTDRSEQKPPEAGKHNLSGSLTSFVGREREKKEVERLLGTSRLLTITGTGGCGKTRLAQEVARDLVNAYADGVYLTELASLSESTLVPQAVAEALGVREQPGSSLTDTLADSLSAKTLLLVLDNCEHLVEACAHLVETLLKACPELRILTTSREPLGAAGEVIWQVPSLSGPSPLLRHALEELEGYESVRLFVERARYRNPAFLLDQQNARAVAEICRKLDGIPLAIELAAARAGLSVEQIAARLDDPLRLLTGGNRTATPRQRTLRGALDWSYELLVGFERVLFRRLSVFAGGFSLEAAETVSSGEGIEEEDVLDLLSRLVDKSLVVSEATGDGGVRYRMLEPVRQYAQERLEESGEGDALRGRHAAFFLALAEVAESKLVEPDQVSWFERLEREHDNLRAALRNALDRGKVEPGLRVGGAIWRFWYARGHLSEGRRWLEEALAQPGTAPARAKALRGAGALAWAQGDYARAETLFEESLALRRELGDRQGVAEAINGLASVARDRGEYARARALFEVNLAVCRELENDDGTQITYSTIQDVWKMNANGTGKTNLTINSGGGQNPAWSPDGNSIVYVRSGDIYVMDADDGGNKTAVDTTPRQDVKPDWQPNPPTCDITGTNGDDNPTANPAFAGTPAAETICGLGGNDVINGGGGNDILMGSDGNDTLVVPAGRATLNGGSGKDAASFAGSSTSLTASLITEFAQRDGTDPLEGAALVGIENLTGSSLGDALTGSNKANKLVGGDGADELLGLGGKDRINSRDGVKNDTVNGGPGTDTCTTDRREVSIRSCE
jgi:predicted ATPase/DNA-binding SARP family transcriptional activator